MAKIPKKMAKDWKLKRFFIKSNFTQLANKVQVEGFFC